METECLASKKESSFEIIVNSDEDDMLTASLYSSIQNSTFESLNCLYFLDPILVTEEEAKNVHEINCDIDEKQIICSKSKETDLSSNPLVELSENNNYSPDITFDCVKTSNLPWMDKISSNKINSPCIDYQNTCTDKELDATEVDEIGWSDEVADKSIWNHSKERGQCNSATGVTLVLKANGNESKLYTDERSEDFEAQIPSDRQTIPSTCCSLIKHGLRAFRSIQSNRKLKNLTSGLKLSFYKLLNTFELEMNIMNGMNDPLKIIITAEASDLLVIEEAFYQSLSGQIIISKFSEDKDLNLPVLPVGYNSAQLVAQLKLNKARLLHDYENNATVISTTTFISEIYPQRWQLSTLLYLEDLNLNLNLHNFTSTIPMPNDYVLQAQKLTPDDYPFKNMGLAVTIGQAIGSTAEDTDFEENLCGICHSVNLKSAAVILAGMYSKYVNRNV